MFQGCGTALVTPFRSDLSLDEETLRRLVHRQIEAGIHFLVPCGTTGENPTLSREEHLRVVEITLEEAQGRTPVLAGCGGNDTREVVELARDLERLGADGLLVVTPFYNKPTPEGLYQHYRAVARATRLPIVVYNVPGRTGLNVEPATLARLAEIETVVGVKEASGNISQIAAIFQAVPDSFAVLSGDDAITLPVIALGGVGVISVVSNEVPFAMARLTSLALEGDFPAAREVQRRLHALMEINFVESNPGPVKAAMSLMGLLEPAFRLPAVYPRPESVRKIEKILLGLGLIPESLEAEETAVENRLAV
jgi:4-hydroxy-tetrahydrodipicolinate synthase